MNNLLNIKNAFVAEWLKSQKTRLLTLTLLIPVLVTGIKFLLAYYTAPETAPTASADPWPSLIAKTFNLLCFVILPMAIVMITSQTMQIEQKANAWKQLLCYPMPRWTVLAGKYLFSLSLVASIHLFILPLLLANGWLLGLVKPQLEFHQYTPDLTALAGTAWNTFLASLSIFAIQFVLSWLVPNYTLPIFTGIFATVIFSSVASAWSKSIYIPYAYPMLQVLFARGTLNVSHWGGLPVFLWYSILYFCFITIFIVWYSPLARDKS
jgi:hypothetical protein